MYTFRNIVLVRTLNSVCPWSLGTTGQRREEEHEKGREGWHRQASTQMLGRRYGAPSALSPGAAGQGLARGAWKWECREVWSQAV